MARWWFDKRKKDEDLSVCPRCTKKAVRQVKYRLNGSSMGRKEESALEKHDLNCVIEYQCESCNHSYR